MRVDSNTGGHRQWFYFSMKNQKKCRVRLHIYRFKKMYSLFQRGMRPYVKSRKSGKEWMPGGDHVMYHYERQRNQYGVNKEVKSFVLTFSFNFQHENDEVFIAAGIPYTYTFLQKQLTYYKEKASKRQDLNFQISTLCKSMCGLQLPMITVEHKMSKKSDQDKKIIIINARTHSGQSSSSWVLDGLLLEFIQNTMIDQWLLTNNVVLKIVPMLNPDGVFIGNYRTGIIGDDFNRKFYSGRKEFYPEIHALRKLINQSKKEGTVELFLDLHGHSILKNSFIYGPSQTDISKFTLKTLPYYLMHNSKYFRFSSCKFKTEKENIETARVFFQLKEEILSFTCQNSLGLYQNHSKTVQMNSGDWQSFGQAILNSIICSYNDDSQIFAQPPSFKSQKSQSQAQSAVSNQPERKFSSHVRMTIQTSKNKKFDKTNICFPSTNKNKSFEKQQIYLSANQINREDQILVFASQKDEKSQAETKKTPVSRLIQNIINRKKAHEYQRNNSNEEKIMLGRSITYDHSEILQRGNEEEEQQQEQQYQMEIINQNFSDDYVSINDSDSESDNLPEQERNYLLEYIKSSHKTQLNQEQEVQVVLQKNPKANKAVKQPKISGFRQIRFRSIEQIYSKEINSTEPLHSNAKKIKFESHKFKDIPTNTLIFKNRPSQYELDDPSIVTFSHQKRLNERSNHRKTYKDPFVLLQRRDKAAQQKVQKDA